MNIEKKRFVLARSIMLCSVVFCAFFTFSLRASATEKKEASPYVIVSSYEVTDGCIVPDKDFALTVVVENVNEESAASDVLINVSSATGINPVYPTMPQFYIGDMEPLEKKEVSFMYRVSSDYKADNAYFSVVVSNSFNSNSVYVSAPIEYGDTIFSAISCAIPESSTIGEPITADLHFKSLSNARLSNVEMTVLSGDEILSQRSIGNLSAGATKSQSATFYLYEKGKYDISVVLSCIDNDGNSHEKVMYSRKVDVKEATDAVNNSAQVDMGLSVIHSQRDYYIIGACIALSFLFLIGIMIVIRKNK